MRSYTKYFFLLVFLISQLSFAWAQEQKPKKKHKSTDTVGVVNGFVIRYYDYREQLKATMKEHKAEIKGDTVSDTAFTRFVNMSWDKMVGDILIEQELTKRKLTLTTEKTIALLMKNPPKELKEVFTDSATGVFDQKAMKAYLTDPNPDLKRTKILDYYQTLLEQERLTQVLVPEAKSQKERTKELAEWLKKKLQKANIDDRRVAFGFY